jgi:hypothetical protein
VARDQSGVRIRLTNPGSLRGPLDRLADPRSRLEEKKEQGKQQGKEEARAFLSLSRALSRIRGGDRRDWPKRESASGIVSSLIIARFAMKMKTVHETRFGSERIRRDAKAPRQVRASSAPQVGDGGRDKIYCSVMLISTFSRARHEFTGDKP